jgi:hypothetical protein
VSRIIDVIAGSPGGVLRADKIAVHVHLEFGDRFPVGKVVVRDFFVLV